MEFPELGAQCAWQSCRQLDFLPVMCDGCKEKFCNEHWTYEGHECPKKRLKDVQVPVCPLCDKPVPSKPGAVPDEAVSAHLDRDCKAESRQKRSPRCSMAKCKTRELIKVDCDTCKQNYCLKHRHPQDHNCTGKPAMSAAAMAALNRQQQQQQQQSRPQFATGITKYFTRTTGPPAPTPASRPSPRQIQGNMSEDEALAKALQESMKDTNGGGGSSGMANEVPTSQEEQDRMLALALQESERAARRGQGATASGSSGTDKSCQIS